MTSRVVHVGNVLVLELGSLPDLNFASTTENTNTHGGQEVVGSIGVVVDTTIEDRGGILADGRRDERLATRVVLDEIGYVVDDTSNGNESLAVLGLGDEVIPANYRKLFKRSAPVESGTLLIKLLLQLLNTALFDLVGTELLEVRGEAQALPGINGPLGRVVLPPLNGVSVVGGELVVEVVIAFTKSDESSDEVVTGRVAVIEGLVSEPMSQRVDAESSLLNEADAENASIDETTKPVVEHETTEASREDKTHEDDTLQVVLVLPNDDGILVQISDISTASTLRILLEHHPSQVRVQEALANGVGILLSVGVTVVSSVAAGPPADRAFDGASAYGSKVDLEGKTSSVRSVRPKTVITYMTS
jgi:hypothetical protein